MSSNDEKVMKDSFVFYRSFSEAMAELSEKEQLALYRAIVGYGLDADKPVFESPYLRMAWKLIQPQLDANWKRYKNGRKGGAPFGNRNNPKGRRGNQPRTNQEPTKNQPNVNVNENGNVNENVNENVSSKDDITLSPKVESIARVSKDEAINYDAFLRYWNNLAEKIGFQKILLASWTDGRKKKLRELVKAFGKDKVIQALQEIEKSEFIRKNPAFVTFDWFISSKDYKFCSFTKLLDGFYRNDYNKPNKVVKDHNALLREQVEKENAEQLEKNRTFKSNADYKERTKRWVEYQKEENEKKKKKRSIGKT